MKKKVTRREDYLKLIYTLSKKGEVRGADLATELDVKRPTVSVYLKQLIENGDMKELTEDPNSVSALKKVWSYKKLDDGTLIITSYKGDAMMNKRRT